VLRNYSWEKLREQHQHYRRRRPENTDLYRVVYHSRAALEHQWEERFQQKYGALRNEVLSALDSYLNCGLLEHGAARVYCDSCKHSLLIAFSCKKRGVCPSCSSKRAVKFAEHLFSEVLEDVPTRHVVFSIPKRLRPYFRYDRTLSSILFKAAWKSIQLALGSDDGELGLILALQTAGDALNWNPHLHGLLADGRFLPDGSFKPFSKLDLSAIQRRFSELVLSQFAKRELITDEVMSQILSQEHTGFSVWFGEPFQDEESDKFVARYVERGPLSLEKLSVDEDNVISETKDGTSHKFDPLEFLALLSSHIPNSYESITRYYGYYSCRARGERKKRIPQPEQQNTAEKPQKASSLWARCIKQLYELNPLECPNCRAEMRIIAFIHDHSELAAIIRSLKLPNFRAPPPLPKKHSEPQLEFDQMPDYDA